MRVPRFEEVAGLVRAPSAAVLVVANLVPLLGVFFLGWDLGFLLLLYWAESAIIGALNAPKMILAGGWRAIPITLFFLFHFGWFMFGHLVFIVTIFVAQTPWRPDVVEGDFGLSALLRSLVLPFIALAASHTFSFVRNFIQKREWEGTTTDKLMVAPYGRIVLMHVTLVVGGGIALSLGSPKPALAVMVLLKVVADLRAHARSHNLLAQARGEAL